MPPEIVERKHSPAACSRNKEITDGNVGKQESEAAYVDSALRESKAKGHLGRITW